MAALQPVVLEVTSVARFLEHLLANHAHPTTLLIGAPKDAFINHLIHECDAQAARQMNPADADVLNRDTHFTPSLRMLAQCRSVTATFCHDIAQLRAYLATYSTTVLEREDLSIPSGLGNTPTLAVLNLVELHRGTNAFSAQGLNRSMALAVEAAHRSHSKLVMVEIYLSTTPDGEIPLPESGADQSENNMPVTSYWSEEISMLNITTKKFGVGDRGWVGRTVSLRTVAARWCTFQSLYEP